MYTVRIDAGRTETMSPPMSAQLAHNTVKVARKKGQYAQAYDSQRKPVSIQQLLKEADAQGA